MFGFAFEAMSGSGIMSQNLWELKNKTILSAWVSPDQESLAFFCEGEIGARWNAVGDCCSQSWFADLVGVEALLGATVLDVEQISMDHFGYDVEDGRGRQECDPAYGFKILTTKGWCDVVFRNSSNGYYGGELCCSSWSQAEAPSLLDGWEHLTQDWSCGDGRAYMAQPIASWIAAREAREIGQAAGPGRPNPSAPKSL